MCVNGFGWGWAGSGICVLISVGFLHPTPHLSHLSLSVHLLVRCGPVLVLGVLLLSIAFMMVMNLVSLSMPFSVPTSLSRCAFLPMPRSECWFRYFRHSLSMCCLVWIVCPHSHEPRLSNVKKMHSMYWAMCFLSVRLAGFQSIKSWKTSTIARAIGRPARNLPTWIRGSPYVLLWLCTTWTHSFMTRLPVIME